METREKDLQHLGSILNLGFLDPSVNKQVSEKCATQRGFDGETTKDIMNREMSKLEEEARKKLCDMFMIDFLLFDYHSKWCNFSQIIHSLS